MTLGWIEREADDLDFRYCLCHRVPTWWHGSQNLLAAGVCCENERRKGGLMVRRAHIRLPVMLRHFKLTKETKESLLHSMIHAYLYLEKLLLPDEPFYAHTRSFQRIMHRINTDTLTLDLYRPKGGYGILYDDTNKEREDAAKRQALVDDLSEDHFKMLYIISKYSHQAEHANDTETWIRKLPLLVLVYEGIVEGLFDYDYAPTSVFISGRRVYINLTQEGRDHIDDLIEAEMCRSLRLATSDHQPVTAVQITQRGEAILRNMPASVKHEVQQFITAPDGKSLLSVMYRGDHFYLSGGGHIIESTVTDIEDVSYVCSPYLPRCLLDPKKPMSSNAHRALESAIGESNVKDELDEAITLSRVVVLVGEYLPFGSNQMVELNEKLGTRDPIKGGSFCETTDECSIETNLEVPPGLTQVNINSHNKSHFVNLEAEVFFPEDEGIVQVEQIGIRYAVSGSTLYGLKVEAVQDRIMDTISLDNIARMMVDVAVDSSKITDSIINEHQRHLLDVVFAGHSRNRDKCVVFMAEDITPHMTAAKYRDGDRLENEIKQVIGDVQRTYDLTEIDVVIFGTKGVLFAGPEAFRHEPILLAYLSLRGRESFVVNFFNRLFVLDDQTKEVREAIAHFSEDPNSVSRIRSTLHKMHEDTLLLGETLHYLEQSMEEDFLQALPHRDHPDFDTARRLFELLDIERTQESLGTRIVDVRKQVDATLSEVLFLMAQCHNCGEILKRRVIQDTANMYIGVSEQMRRMDAASVSLDIMQWIFSGELAFKSIDRMTGEWTLQDTWARQSLFYGVIWPNQMYIAIVAFVLWGIIGHIVLKSMRVTADRRTGMVSTRFRVQRSADLQQLKRYLASRGVLGEDIAESQTSLLTCYTWEENKRKDWLGYTATINLVVELKHRFIQSATVRVVRPASAPAKLFPRDLRRILLTAMEEARVFVRHSNIVALSGETDSLRIFLVRESGKSTNREVLIDKSTLDSLQNRIAAKFLYRPENVVSMSVTEKLHDGTTHSEVLDTDHQVVALRPYSLIDVLFQGAPDPALALLGTIRGKDKNFTDLLKRQGLMPELKGASAESAGMK